MMFGLPSGKGKALGDCPLHRSLVQLMGSRQLVLGTKYKKRFSPIDWDLTWSTHPDYAIRMPKDRDGPLCRSRPQKL